MVFHRLNNSRSSDFFGNRFYANYTPFPRKVISRFSKGDTLSTSKNTLPFPRPSPFAPPIESNYSQFRGTSGVEKSYSKFPRKGISQIPRNAFSPFPNDSSSPILRHSRYLAIGKKIANMLHQINNARSNDLLGNRFPVKYSSFPWKYSYHFSKIDIPSSLQNYSKFPRDGNSSAPKNYSPFPRSGISAAEKGHPVPRKGLSQIPSNAFSPILRQSRYPTIGKKASNTTANNSPSLKKTSSLNKNNRQNTSQEQAASMLNRLVLASLSLWIGAIAFYWLAKLREMPCDPNQAPEIIMIIKGGEKSFRASNTFHAKLPNISKARKYKDFKQACDRLKFRGVAVEPSLTQKGLWHFFYTVERATLDEVLEDERRLSKIVNDELRELARLENFSKFLRWFKYAK